MTLKRALTGLHRDRDSDALLREVLGLFRKRAGEWVDGRTLLGMSDGHSAAVEPLLDVLARSFVLDFDVDGGRYRMPKDRFLMLEVDGFLRQADARNDHLQANVARFRDRYGSR